MEAAATAISPMAVSGVGEEVVELGVFVDRGVLVEVVVVVVVLDVVPGEATVTALRRVMRSAATGSSE